MMKSKVLFVVGLPVLMALGFALMYYSLHEKTAYVDVKQLYDGFQMKKELEKQFKLVQNQRDKVLDSMELELKVMAQRISRDEKHEGIEVFNARKENFMGYRQRFQEDNQATVQDYDAKILKQLNQYIDDFGKKEGYTYIYGYSGSGELLYSEKGKDITGEVIGFVNTKYKGL